MDRCPQPSPGEFADFVKQWPNITRKSQKSLVCSPNRRQELTMMTACLKRAGMLDELFTMATINRKTTAPS
jgi:hypothetical protein